MTKNSSGLQAGVMQLCLNGRVETIPQNMKTTCQNHMQTKLIIGGVLSAALLAFGAAGCASGKSEQARLLSQARISQAQAQTIALARVPNGTIKEGDLEKEKGILIWSFDIATPGSPNITEVAVDAHSGQVVSVDVETPAQQAAEKD